MKTILLTAGAAALIVVALPSYGAQPKPTQPPELTDESLTRQVSQSIVQSAEAVACSLRTSGWRGAVMHGWIAMLGVALPSIHPDLDDDELRDKIGEILKYAWTDAALNTQFAAPNAAECQTFSMSHDMKELDASANMGQLFEAVHKPR